MYRATSGDVAGEKLNYSFPMGSSSKLFPANSSSDTLYNTESVLYPQLWMDFFTMRNNRTLLIRCNM